MEGLTVEELEALSGLPYDTILQGVSIGLYDHGWLLSREPLRFHERTVAMLQRTMPLLDRVAARKMTMARFHSILWTLAQAGPARLAEYLAPPSNAAAQAVLVGRAK
jgi:hypothetical protein